MDKGLTSAIVKGVGEALIVICDPVPEIKKVHEEIFEPIVNRPFNQLPGFLRKNIVELVHRDFLRKSPSAWEFVGQHT